MIDIDPRALVRAIEASWMLERDFALWQGGCEGVLHGVKNTADLSTYEGRALDAMPK